MIKIIKKDSLGQADFGWLQAQYHFSFARYFNRDRMGFGLLRVINDDIVKAGHGFDTHPHDNMEIITFVKEGAITHADSQGNKGRTEAGDVQVMSAGSGIAHSEYNYEDIDTKLYQIWIQPNQRNVEPRWETSSFMDREIKNRLPVLVSGRPEEQKENVLYIHQDAAIYGGQLKKDAAVTHSLKHLGYLLVADGEIEINGHKSFAGDGVEITDEKDINIRANQNSVIILIDVPNE